MKNSITHYDVVIVGASVGGSSAAILFARQGLRVALIERQPDINAYKQNKSVLTIFRPAQRPSFSVSAWHW